MGLASASSICLPTYVCTYQLINRLMTCRRCPHACYQLLSWRDAIGNALVEDSICS